jgi:hypothetical protein
VPAFEIVNCTDVVDDVVVSSTRAEPKLTAGGELGAIAIDGAANAAVVHPAITSNDKPNRFDITSLQGAAGRPPGRDAIGDVIPSSPLAPKDSREERDFGNAAVAKAAKPRLCLNPPSTWKTEQADGIQLGMSTCRYCG